MPIERLLYGINGADPYGLRYGDKTITANQSIRKMFKIKGEAEMKPDRVIPNQIIPGFTFRMGWDTAVVFEKQQMGSLIIKQVYDIGTGLGKNVGNVIGNNSIYQITTQSVDTCTLVYIETNKECLLAHFGVRMAGKFKTLAETIFPKTSNINFVLYSGGGAESYQEFGINTQMDYNSLVQWMCGYNPQVFDRMAPLYGKYGAKGCYFSHMEFGIGWDGNTTTYFGDIVCRSVDEDENSLVPYTCGTYEWSDIEKVNMKMKAMEVLGLVVAPEANIQADLLEEVTIMEPEEGCCTVQ